MSEQTSVKASHTREKVEKGSIKVLGAREHNLRGFDLDIPRNRLIVVTGLSGSGKSSLAFDTIYAEGQRRFMETFSAYARQYIGQMKRPDVDKIEGLSPVISIEQKTVSKNPRSTVGTITELYDFLRLFYAKTADAYSWKTGKKMVRFSDDQIYENIKKEFAGRSINIFAPVISGRKGIYQDLFKKLHSAGFEKARIDGELKKFSPSTRLSRYKIHDIDILIDRVKVSGKEQIRLKESVMLGLKQSSGTIVIQDTDTGKDYHYSRDLMCPDTGISYNVPEPNTFSFNTPYGYCGNCRGTGYITQPDFERAFPNKELTFEEAVLKWIQPFLSFFDKKAIHEIQKKYKFQDSTPLKKVSNKALQILWNGSDTAINVKFEGEKYAIEFEGLAEILYESLNTSKKQKREIVESLLSQKKCPECNGHRLKKEALYFKVDGKNIGEASALQMDHFYDWICSVEKNLSGAKKDLGQEILKEIKQRTGFLLNVGLDYLSLDRPAYSLSGGEAQRTRLATQIGTQLINVTYILDEPSIGLHQRDNHLLTESLKQLRDIGNTVMVVEHDRDMIETADHVIDLGPKAGINGGYLTGEGPPDHISSLNSLTGDYLANRKTISVPETRRHGKDEKIQIKGASGHNLKNVNADFPLGNLICITGVSGSGKSTLITETLIPALKGHLGRQTTPPLPYKEISGLKHLDKVIEINQAPIGRTPRSNPATYTGVFTHIRQLFASTPGAKVRGYNQGRFSFNVKGGRCETCKGAGVKLLEMNFLEDVHLECSDCMGKRYNRQTLEVRYKGKSISDVLEMSIEEALEFFEPIPKIRRNLKTLSQVGLGYIKVGQPSTTLSGGEAQRVKLATELAKQDTGKTLYMLDEPTTGLHFEDIRILMSVLEKLVDKGNTVMIIEHNPDVIKKADHLIDIGPEGGDKGGKVVFQGTPEKLVKKQPKNHTARFLKEELSRKEAKVES